MAHWAGTVLAKLSVLVLIEKRACRLFPRKGRASRSYRGSVLTGRSDIGKTMLLQCSMGLLPVKDGRLFFAILTPNGSASKTTSR